MFRIQTYWQSVHRHQQKFPFSPQIHLSSVFQFWCRGLEPPAKCKISKHAFDMIKT